MTRPKPPRLLDLTDGYAVAGTHDIHTALEIVVDEHWSFQEYDRRIDDPTLTAADVQHIADELAARMYGFIERARTGYWRTVPALRGYCACGEGHDWDALPATPGTPGAYKVVWWE
jgi:hypothetical protein